MKWGAARVPVTADEGGLGFAQLTLCLSCGAAVLDPSKHATWHRKQRPYDQQKHPAQKATEMLRELALCGWGVKEIAENLGWNVDTVSSLRLGKSLWIANERAQDLRLEYFRLRDQPREDARGRRVRTAALKRGWKPIAR